MAKLKEVSETVTPIDAPHITKEDKELTKEKLKRLIEEETKIVKGRFRNHETPGGSTTIIVRKYPGIPAFEKNMRDGEVYEIPLYVARHLQGYDVTAKAVGGRINTCSYAVHGYKTDRDGFPDKNMDSGMSVPIIFKRRYSFESLEFENAL